MIEISALQLDRILVAFNGVPVLQDLTLNLSKGSRNLIIGANGAGKTTLFNVISGSLRPKSGRVVVAGSDLTSRSSAKRARSHISRSFQVPKLSGALTCREHVLLSLERRRSILSSPLRTLGLEGLEREAETVLEKFALEAVSECLVAQLSHANRKLVEIATAFAAETELLLLDEPTSGIGATEKERLLSIIAAIGNSRTVLVIEHDRDFARSLGWPALLVEDGRINSIDIIGKLQ